MPRPGKRNVELDEATYQRLTTCRKSPAARQEFGPGRITNSTIFDAALQSWLDMHNMSYEELVNRQLAMLMGDNK